MMRPMFLDYPADESMFNLASQFMFGDNILVAPKLDTNLRIQTAYLPSECSWYNYNTKMIETESSPIKKIWSDKEMPVFYRAGTILPILLHENALSLLRAFNNDIELEIYPTSEGDATGKLVLDDGWSTKTNLRRLRFNYYAIGRLTMNVEGDYKSSKAVSTVSIYGVKQAPVMIMNLITNEKVSFAYDKEAMSVKINDLGFKLDQESTSFINLLQITWPTESVVA